MQIIPLQDFEVGIGEDGRVEVAMQDRAIVIRLQRLDAKRLAVLIDAAAKRARK